MKKIEMRYSMQQMIAFVAENMCEMRIYLNIGISKSFVLFFYFDFLIKRFHFHLYGYLIEEKPQHPEYGAKNDNQIYRLCKTRKRKIERVLCLCISIEYINKINTLINNNRNTNII